MSPLRFPSLTNRRIAPADLATIDLLMSRTFPRLLAADYPPSVRVLALPLISRANPLLLGSGRYYAGSRPGGGSSVRGAGCPWAVARGLMARILESAHDEGLLSMECPCTRTAEPFYAAQGFKSLGPVDVALAPGIVFPAIPMRRAI